jgi:molybdenum cofactor synthesis domain-containing protein
LIAVGRELLRGHVADADSAAIAAFFSRRGAIVHRVTIVDDTGRAVAEALREALDRNPGLVVTTGGLGPAPDDVTLDGVATTLGQPLKISQPARDLVEAAYQRLASRKLVRSAALTLAREKLCKIPVGSTPVPNEAGVSPGVVCKLPGGAAVICLPGSPDEALSVLDAALSLLQEFGSRTHTAVREVEAPSPDESALWALLEQMKREYPGIWISSRPARDDRNRPIVTIILEASGPTEKETEAAASAALQRLLALAGGSR